MSYPFIIQGSNVVVVIDNKPHTISKTHITYQKIVDAIKAGDWETVKNVIDPKKVVINYGRGNVSVQGDTLYWQGEVFNGTLASRMIQMLQEGFSIKPMVAFMDNLMDNPSKRSVDELYGFLEKNNLPITPDGHFLAYKRVRDDFKDCHTGTMDNSPGTVVEMPRNKVDDDKDRTCSTGLHFCSQEYLKSFGGARTVIVKINPRDVVSIPSDYNNSKGRACRYEVISELGVKEEDAFTRSVQSTANRPVKEGSSPFYHGYNDGYHGYSVDATQFGYNRTAYEEGYEKGQDDRSNGVERYRLKTISTNFGAWPNPA
jgi:hypothetical protein